MDSSQHKDYVLVLLFIKYVSDKYAGIPYTITRQLAGLEYQIEDLDGLVDIVYRT
jgi:type I restriction enzyme M protein